MKFVVVGGLALGAWGVVRGTKDVDIVVAPDAENLKRLAAVLRQHTLHEGRDPWCRVAVCSIEDLKAMKRPAGRTRDLVDLEDLDAASQ